MTAPALPQLGQSLARSPRQMVGRRRSGGSADALNGQIPVPGQSQSGAAPQGGPPSQAGGQGQWQRHAPAAPAQGAQQPAPTFAQMQANGQARPAPPLAPQMSSQMTATGAYTAPVQSGQPGDIKSSLASSVQQALQNPSAYGAPQVQSTYNMLNQDLGQQYDYQRKQLNEEMAARGLSESSIAGQRYSDLATEQARAQANMVTQLTNQAAQQYGTDRSLAQTGGQNFLSSQLAETLGLGNLSLGQGQLALQGELGRGSLGVQQGQLDLSKQGLAQSGSQFDRSLAQSGSEFNKTFGLQSQAQTAQQEQFRQQLQQALGIATMGDKTANRGVDANAALANNDLMLRVAQLLAGMGGGYPTGGGGSPPAAPPQGQLPPSNPTGGNGGDPSDPTPNNPLFNPSRSATGTPDQSSTPGGNVVYNGITYLPNGRSADGRYFMSPTLLAGIEQNQRRLTAAQGSPTTATWNGQPIDPTPQGGQGYPKPPAAEVGNGGLFDAGRAASDPQYAEWAHNSGLDTAPSGGVPAPAAPTSMGPTSFSAWREQNGLSDMPDDIAASWYETYANQHGFQPNGGKFPGWAR